MEALRRGEWAICCCGVRQVAIASALGRFTFYTRTPLLIGAAVSAAAGCESRRRVRADGRSRRRMRYGAAEECSSLSHWVSAAAPPGHARPSPPCRLSALRQRRGGFTFYPLATRPPPAAGRIFRPQEVSAASAPLRRRLSGVWRRRRLLAVPDLAVCWLPLLRAARRPGPLPRDLPPGRAARRPGPSLRRPPSPPRRHHRPPLRRPPPRRCAGPPVPRPASSPPATMASATVHPPIA